MKQYTDVLGGKRAGLRTVLVLSGVTSADQVGTALEKPDAVVANLAGLGSLLGWSSES